ncbi:unnamed protein product [Urochloa decumbens]|uniref:Pentatricopeptide repeat-containing protein n=1 Tax=Urochloa decumbens TaxID=240449 RepID=A0ABC8WW31_9POAL
MALRRLTAAAAGLTRTALPPCRRALCSGAPRDGDLEAAVRDVVCSGSGSLDEVGGRLDRLGVAVSPALVDCVIDSCGQSGGVNSGRRLLRFLSWCRSKDPGALGDEALDRAIGVLARVGDLTAMRIAICDAEKDRRRMAPEAFTAVVEALVNAGKEDEAVRLFRGLERQGLLPERGNSVGGDGVWSSSLAMVQALCKRGYAREAQGVVYHHKSELSVEPMVSIVERSLLHGWCVHGNAKEARRVLDGMKSAGVPLGLPSFNDFLHCVCHRNLKFNPSALVPEAMDILTEMRSYGVTPAASSFNILLSCLGRARRVKEAYRILYLMREGKPGCSPDWVSYYLVVRVLYLTGRIVRGKRLVDAMLESGVLPTAKFFHGLIGVLCGTEQVDHALDMFRLMKSYELVDTRIYDLLIEKLCRNGRFELGRELWDDATKSGLVLGCSEDLLDPLKTEVFRPACPAQKLSPQSYKCLTQRKKITAVGARKKTAITASRKK